MKIFILKYDNGYAVTVTDPVADAQGKEMERKVKRVFLDKEAMLAFIQEKL